MLEKGSRSTEENRPTRKEKGGRSWLEGDDGRQGGLAGRKGALAPRVWHKKGGIAVYTVAKGEQMQREVLISGRKILSWLRKGE